MSNDPKNGNQYDSDPPDDFFPVIPPWQDSQLLQLTPAEVEEQEALEKELEQYAADQQQDYDALSAALDEKESYGLTFEILIQAFGYLKAHPSASIAEAIQYGFDEWVK